MRWTIEPLAAPVGNHTIKGRNPWTWAEFDTLPAEVRQVIAFAPMRLGTRRAADALRGGASARQVAIAEYRIALRFQAVAALATYGPDHPQAKQENPGRDSDA